MACWHLQTSYTSFVWNSWRSKVPRPFTRELVSRWGSVGRLKSPHIKRCPYLTDAMHLNRARKKWIWCEFGAYTATRLWVEITCNDDVSALCIQKGISELEGKRVADGQEDFYFLFLSTCQVDVWIVPVRALGRVGNLELDFLNA